MGQRLLPVGTLQKTIEGVPAALLERGPPGTHGPADACRCRRFPPHRRFPARLPAQALQSPGPVQQAAVSAGTSHALGQK